MKTSTDMTYPDLIASLADTYLTRRTPSTSIAPLTTALGCRRINVDRGGWYHQRAKQPAMEFEPLVRQTLIEALRSHVCSSVIKASEDGMSILDGLARNDRWRDALADIDDTYCLAALLMHMTFDGDDAAELISCEIVNTWLRPGTIWVEYPSIHDLSRALFGDAWTTLVIEDPSFFAWDILPTIMTMRPLLSAGLSPCQVIETPLPLPAMDA